MTEYELHDAPPPPSRAPKARKHFPEDLLAFLEENPGKWAIGARTKSPAQANYWRKPLGERGFTIASRKIEDGTYEHWIGYDAGEED